MTKREEAYDDLLVAREDWDLSDESTRWLVGTIAAYLLADDEPAKVDTSLRGWVIMDDITPYFAREVGLFRGKMRGQVQWTWDEVVNDLEDSTIRKMTPADLEVTE